MTETYLPSFDAATAITYPSLVQGPELADGQVAFGDDVAQVDDFVASILMGL